MGALKHALFIAFHYPPEASSSGVLRTLKYTRYLAEYGWRTTIIAPQENAYEIVDSALVRQVPATTAVVRTRFLNTKRHLSIRGSYPRWFAIPDTWIGWLPWAVSAGRRVFRCDPYDLIYSTSPHATSHLVALRLATYSGKPWVTDFRDPWYEDPPEAPVGPLYQWANRTLEARVVRKCSRVVASTTQLRDMLRERYPDASREKFSAILNGYDEADFASLQTPETNDSRLTMVHAGSINSSFRDPRPLLAALRNAANRGAIDAGKICVRFIGGGTFAESSEMRRCVQDLGLEQSVEFLPRVSYGQSLSELSRASLLLLLQASADTATLVPAKLYEYLRTFKPVLALVNEGGTSEVLNKTGGGWAVTPENPRALEDAVAQVYRLWGEKKLDSVRASSEALRQFDRRVLTGKLAAIFHEVASNS